MPHGPGDETMFTWLAGFFANPAMLAGAATGSIPVIIHLLNKQRHKRLHWAAMHWLWASQKKSSRRLRIEQLILLLLRILLMILLALALAKPFLQEGMGLLGGRANVYRVIVLDNSYSMGRLVAGQVMFDKAKELAADMVQNLRPGDEVDVLLANDTAEELTTTNALKHAEVIRDIKTAQLSDGNTHLPHAIAAACRLMSKRESSNVRKEIIVITDRTRNGWEHGGRPKKLDSADEEAVAELFNAENKRERPRIWVVRMGAEDTPENMAVSGLEVDEKVVTLNVETQLVATVTNLGRETRHRVPVELYVDGEKAGREEIATLEPKKPETVVFRHTFIEPGSHGLKAEIRTDDLPPDDNGYLVLDVKEQIKVLCVDGQQRVSAMGSELDFFRQALSPSRAAEVGAGKMALYPEIISDGAFPDANLDEYGLVVLANVALIPEEKIAVMKNYVEKGGSLWFWLGDRIDPALYNKELGAILPATIGEAVGLGDHEGPRERLGEKNFDHPALEKLQNIQDMTFGELEVFRRFKLTPKAATENQSVRTVLSYENNDVCALEWTLGEGRVMLFGTTADRAWTNWTNKKHYLPLINVLALDLIRLDHAQRNRMVGEAFEYALPRELLGAVRREGLKLSSPGGDPITMDVVTEQFAAYSKPVGQAGIYQADMPAETPYTVHFAANRSLTESDLDTIDDVGLMMYLPEAEGDTPEGGRFFDSSVFKEDFVVLGDDVKQVEASLQKHLSGKEIWRWLIGAVLALLLIESILAMRFGNYQR